MATAQLCEKLSFLSEWFGFVIIGPDSHFVEFLGNLRDVPPEKASIPMSKETATNGSLESLSPCDNPSMLLK